MNARAVAGLVMVAVLVLQVAGFVVLYVLLRRIVVRRTGVSDASRELRAEVDALVAELNGTAERNVALLEDGVRRLEALLGQVEGGLAGRSATPPPAAVRAAQPVASVAERRAEVLRLRRMGLSNEAIVDRLATSPGEVELIVNLADRAPRRDAT